VSTNLGGFDGILHLSVDNYVIKKFQTTNEHQLTLIKTNNSCKFVFISGLLKPSVPMKDAIYFIAFFVKLFIFTSNIKN